MLFCPLFFEPVGQHFFLFQYYFGTFCHSNLLSLKIRWLTIFLINHSWLRRKKLSEVQHHSWEGSIYPKIRLNFFHIYSNVQMGARRKHSFAYSTFAMLGTCCTHFVVVFTTAYLSSCSLFSLYSFSYFFLISITSSSETSAGMK